MRTYTTDICAVCETPYSHRSDTKHQRFCSTQCAGKARRVERPPCPAEGCDRLVQALGWCHVHYKRMRNHGSTSKLLPVQNQFVPRGCIDCGSALIPNRNRYNRCQPCANRAYRATHRAEHNAETRRYKASHREENAKKWQIYRAAKLEQIRAKNRAYTREYTRTHPEKNREYGHRRRARLRSAFVTSVSMDMIYLRDGGICQICKKLVKRSQASMDHVLPLSQGGTHEPRNVRLAHRKCNTKRGYRGTAQLRLLG
jgi:5-methylcytosine-specific restriction endonuclease McrA